MKYRIECIWNKQTVLEGECSAAMAYQIITNFGKAFPHPERVGYVVPSLESLLNAPQGTLFLGSGKDATGYALFFLHTLK